MPGRRGRAGRDRTVLVAPEEIRRTSRYAPRARSIEELSDGELAMISEAQVSAEHDHLDALLDGLCSVCGSACNS